MQKFPSYLSYLIPKQVGLIGRGLRGAFRRISTGGKSCEMFFGAKLLSILLRLLIISFGKITTKKRPARNQKSHLVCIGFGRARAEFGQRWHKPIFTFKQTTFVSFASSTKLNADL
ncbi:MAG: hypothetical protein R2788_09335 [Saprospiraceae bacterium]